MGYFDGIDSKGEFEIGGGEPLPNGTQVLAAADEARWVDYQGDSRIDIRWNVLSPKEYAGRKVFQKLRVEDQDPKKAERARKMLAAIDANAGGHLMAANESPTDISLQRHLCGKPMVLRVSLYRIQTDDGEKTGNWVSAVSPRKGSEPAPAPKPAAPGPEIDEVPF